MNDAEATNELSSSINRREEITRIGTPSEMEPVVEEVVVSNAVTSVYEVPPGENPPSITKSKSRLSKHRSSSKVQLIKDEEDGGSLSSAHSVQSMDTKMEEYAKARNENVLQGFSSPKNVIEASTHPVQLTEETVYGNLEVERILESAADRPDRPSPKQSQRISFVNQQNDYVMRVNAKHHSSNSSLSTLALHDQQEDQGKLESRISRTSKPNLSPTREESIESKRSSSSKVSSIPSSRKIDVASLQNNDTENEEPALLEEQNLNTSELSLSNRPLVRVQEKTPRHSEVSELSLSEAALAKQTPPKEQEAESKKERTPKHSTVSTTSNLTLASEKFPMISSETELTRPVPDEKPVVKENDLVLTNALSEDSTLIFEDQFAIANDENIDFLHQSLMTEERQKSPRKSPTTVTDVPKKQEAGFISDADSKKLMTYVDAFKRKKRDSDQYSFGSETGGSDSGVPIAVLNEEADTFALKDSLQRVKKLSDAFPTVTEQDKQKKESLPRPRFQSHQSMSELSVVEYNRKKKLKKKRSSTTAPKEKQLPPIRGRKPLPELMEEKYRSESDV